MSRLSRWMPRLIGTAVVLIACLATPARLFGQVGTFERLFGATNVNGVVGNGGLSAAFSRDGDLTVLKWPSPSYHDHLNYLTSNEEDARMLPHLGAAENMGAFAGVIYRPFGPFRTTTSWLREEGWSREQRYVDEDVAILLTRAEHPGLGITVEQYSFVLPGQDVLVNRYVVARSESSPVAELWLLYYENLAPCDKRIEIQPLGCWTGDAENDFAVAYSASRDALVHFLPETVDYTPFGGLLDGGVAPLQVEVDDLIGALDATFAPGIYIALGTSPRSSSHQCGFDAETVCSDSWEPRAEDAYVDATDGGLSGSSLAVCQANAAIAVPIELDADGRGEATVFLTFANTAATALALLDEARSTPAAERMEETAQWWRDWIAPATLPRSDDTALRVFSKRALITLRIYSDRTTGAIVDSIQPPWQVWPMDVADHSLALDLAGYHDLAERAGAFLLSVQRSEAGESIFGPFPTASFAEAHYADGTLAGPIPFIISWTSRVVWGWWTHATFIDDPDRRREYLKTVYPGIRSAAEMLADCRDDETGLHCPASCSESFELTQGLWDAAGVHLALRSAVAAGTLLEEEEDVLRRWEERADELRDAILASDRPTEEPCDYWWMWPNQVVPDDDDAMQDLSNVLWEELTPGLNREAGITGIFYSGWYMTTLARAWRGDEERLANLEEAIRIYTAEMPTPDTHHLGDDVLLSLDGAGDWVNVTATPNIFSSSNVYIAAMALYNPELFDRIEAFPPDNGSPGGCGCNAVGGSAESGTAPALWVVVLVLLRTARRKAGGV